MYNTDGGAGCGSGGDSGIKGMCGGREGRRADVNMKVRLWVMVYLYYCSRCKSDVLYT